MQTEILEPVKEYTRLKKEFSDNAKEYFENLVKESRVDEEANKIKVKEYDEMKAKYEEARGKVSSIKAIKGLMIFFAIVAFIVGVVFAVLGGTSIGDDSASLQPWLSILIGGLCIVLGVFLLVLIKKKINKVVAKREKISKDFKEKAEDLYTEAFNMMIPLNSLFDWGMTAEIIKKTTPIIQFDDNFDVRKLEYLCSNFDFKENYDKNISSHYVATGSLVGNPFVFERQFVHEMSTKTYTGSLTVTWTETERNSEGNMVTVTRSQTLTASVVKPYPIYNYRTLLRYGNEAAPDLCFSRVPSKANNMSDKQIDKYVEKGEKKLSKKAKKAIMDTESSFMEMANSEFDVLFGAINRTSEVQFRLLFTPLAQRNMVDLIKDAEPFGDDFHFIKQNKLNTIISNHAQNWNISTNPTQFFSHDLQDSRARFIKFNEEYFESVFFDLAPILSIPLYQQNKPHEYIYKDNYPRNCTSYEAEVMANSFNIDYFKHSLSATPAILKSSIINKQGISDNLCITAYSYQAIERVDIIPVMCRNGRMYNVPVPWIEYIPLSKDTNMQLCATHDKRKIFENEISQYLSKYGIDIPISFQRGMFALIPIAGFSAIGSIDRAIGEVIGKGGSQYKDLLKENGILIEKLKDTFEKIDEKVEEQLGKAKDQEVVDSSETEGQGISEIDDAQPKTIDTETVEDFETETSQKDEKN